MRPTSVAGKECTEGAARQLHPASAWPPCWRPGRAARCGRPCRECGAAGGCCKSPTDSPTNRHERTGTFPQRCETYKHVAECCQQCDSYERACTLLPAVSIIPCGLPLLTKFNPPSKHTLSPIQSALALVMQGPAAALLTLDCPAKLGENAGRARLSTLGAAMLSTLMRFDKVAISGSSPFLLLVGTPRLRPCSPGCACCLIGQRKLRSVCMNMFLSGGDALPLQACVHDLM